MKRLLFATMAFDGCFKPLTGLAVHLRELERVIGIPSDATHQVGGRTRRAAA